MSYPVAIENEYCYKISVDGILDDKRTYEIADFAINPDNNNRYFYNDDTGEFQRLNTTPTFACKTSPDKKMRIESIGMNPEYGDGPNGQYALKEMRIINI